MISFLQSIAEPNDTAFDVIHHPRKLDRSVKTEDRPNLFDLTKPVTLWLEEASGPRALVNQTFSRFGFAPATKDHKNADLAVRGVIKGVGETGLWLLERAYDDSGDPLGYRRIGGKDQLSVEDKAILDLIPVNKPLRFCELLKEIWDGNKKREKTLLKFIVNAVAAKALVATGKDKTPSKRYTRIEKIEMETL
jgi:hypothetical protein